MQKKTILMGGAIGAGGLCSVVALAALTVPTDIQQPGTQPGQIGNLETPNKCDNCHGGYNPAVEPAYGWRGSMMGKDLPFEAQQAALDPKAGGGPTPRPGAKPQDPRSFYEKLDFSNGNLSEQALDRAAALPGEAKTAFQYYLQHVEEQDWGSVSAYRFTTDEGQETYAVQVNTDGDDGWIEVFDKNGKPLASGRTGLEDDGQGGFKQSYAWDQEFGASRSQTDG